MTIKEAIDMIDDLKPNHYSTFLKIGWLSELDLDLWRMVITQHTGNEDTPEQFTGYDPSMSTETQSATKLLVPEPFCRMYIDWLSSKIDLWNLETGKYNNSALQFDTIRQSYVNWYNTRYMPVQKTLRVLL